MAIQILCFGCRVTIEVEESPNWQVVPCFNCGAPLRMPVAVQKIADAPPSKIDLSATSTGLDSRRDPSKVELAPTSEGSVSSGPVSINEEVNKSASELVDEPVTPRSAKPGSSFDAGEETRFKIKLVLGYLLFVIIPIGGSIVVGVNYFNRMGENKSQPEVVQSSQEDPTDKKNHPDTKVTVGTPPPPEGFTSPWEKIGAIEVRIAGVAIRHVTVLNAEKLPVDSPMPVLAIWLETRITTADKTIELRRWQSSAEESCQLSTDGNEKLPRAPLGPGAVLRTGIPPKQLLGPNLPSRIELLVFTPPSGGVKMLTLTLEANHVGEVGNVNLSIPASTWKK